MSRPKKNTTHRNYLFGDFDGDGVKNIDDYRPFDRKRSKFPDPKKNPEYYHKSRYGGFDTNLSDVLLNIENQNNRNAPLLKKTLRQNPGSYGRVKTVPSTIGKLAKRGLGDLHDTAGATIVEKNRASAKAKRNQVRKKYRTDPKESDNFYKKPGKGGYMAFHEGLIGKNDSRLELQIKTAPMEKLHKDMHEAYKLGKDLTGFKTKAFKLRKLGF